MDDDPAGEVLQQMIDMLINTAESISAGLKSIKQASVADQASLLTELAEITRKLPRAMDTLAEAASKISEIADLLKSHRQRPN